MKTDETQLGAFGRLTISMRIAPVAIIAASIFYPAASFAGAPEVYAQLKSLAGDWEADLPGFGKLTSSVRLASKGMAIEEVIGTPKIMKFLSIP
jgi:hypothetical protein